MAESTANACAETIALIDRVFFEPPQVTLFLYVWLAIPGWKSMDGFLWIDIYGWPSLDGHS